MKPMLHMFFLFLPLLFTGCNTLQGMGMDLQESGKALSNAINPPPKNASQVPAGTYSGGSTSHSSSRY